MKKSRTLQGLVLVGALGALLTFVVLPAFGSATGSPVPPPSTRGITPVDVSTGGQSNDCSLFYAQNPSAQPAYQYRIANPKSQTYATTTPDGIPVTFTLTVNPDDAKLAFGYASNKYFDFASTGAQVVDVGVKGGTDETRYNYSGLFGQTNLGPVSSDGALHPPAQSVDAQGNPTQLYSLSNVTFCYNVARGSVSGTVYQDVNQNGSNDAGDTAQAWTVRLYKGSTAVASTTSSASDGSYHFNLLLDTSSTYRVCEAPPSGTWAQSQPKPNSPNLCTGTGELRKGYSFTPSSSTQALGSNDFGNVPAVACTSPMGTPGSYQIQLAHCKPNEFVFDSGTSASGSPFVSVWASDQTQPPVPMVEKITWPYDVTAGQNQFKVIYNDTFPFTATPTNMQYCQLDPRTSTSSFDLQLPYQDDSAKGSVLPGTETSCLISTTESADGHFVAWIYSDIDGWRSTT
jgi:hypothetical protein